MRKRTKLMSNSKHFAEAFRGNMCDQSHSHQLIQWGGPDGGLEAHDDAQLEKEQLYHQKAELPYDTTGDGVPNDPEPAVDPEPVADEFTLDFGNDFDNGGWKVYWNQ